MTTILMLLDGALLFLALAAFCVVGDWCIDWYERRQQSKARTRRAAAPLIWVRRQHGVKTSALPEQHP